MFSFSFPIISWSLVLKTLQSGGGILLGLLRTIVQGVALTRWRRAGVQPTLRSDLWTEAETDTQTTVVSVCTDLGARALWILFRMAWAFALVAWAMAVHDMHIFVLPYPSHLPIRFS